MKKLYFFILQRKKMSKSLKLKKKTTKKSPLYNFIHQAKKTTKTPIATSVKKSLTKTSQGVKKTLTKKSQSEQVNQHDVFKMLKLKNIHFRLREDDEIFKAYIDAYKGNYKFLISMAEHPDDMKEYFNFKVYAYAQAWDIDIHKSKKISPYHYEIIFERISTLGYTRDKYVISHSEQISRLTIEQGWPEQDLCGCIYHGTVLTSISELLNICVAHYAVWDLKYTRLTYPENCNGIVGTILWNISTDEEFRNKLNHSFFHTKEVYALQDIEIFPQGKVLPDLEFPPNPRLIEFNKSRASRATDTSRQSCNVM
jgi:hypothetical protein